MKHPERSERTNDRCLRLERSYRIRLEVPPRTSSIAYSPSNILLVVVSPQDSERPYVLNRKPDRSASASTPAGTLPTVASVARRLAGLSTLSRPCGVETTVDNVPEARGGYCRGRVSTVAHLAVPAEHPNPRGGVVGRRHLRKHVGRASREGSGRVRAFSSQVTGDGTHSGNFVFWTGVAPWPPQSL
jgi:hypothetical protein